MSDTIRRVLVSPGYGGGWSTWNDNGRELATDAELVRLVEAGEHEGECTVGELRAAGARFEHDFSDSHRVGCSVPFALRAIEVNRGCLPFFGGLRDIEVVTVTGRFRIDEYDGNETLIKESEADWW